MKLYNTMGEEIKIDKNWNEGKIKAVYYFYSIEDNFVYIGVSKDMHKRISKYKADLRNGRHKYKEIQKAWDDGTLCFKILQETYWDMEQSLEGFWLDYAEEFFEGFTILNKQKISHYNGERKTYDTNQKNENNGNSRYTREQILEVKQLVFSGMRNKDIEIKTGISQVYISSIRTERKWASLKLENEVA